MRRRGGGTARDRRRGCYVGGCHLHGRGLWPSVLDRLDAQAGQLVRNLATIGGWLVVEQAEVVDGGGAQDEDDAQGEEGAVALLLYEYADGVNLREPRTFKN